MDNGRQPWLDLDDAELAQFAAGFDHLKARSILLIPIIVSKDQILLDGHQRLRLMQLQGAQWISARDVRIDSTATVTNARERAVAIGANRRQLSVEQKAAVARRFQAESGWSQGRIAELFGVTRPAVSQWLSSTATEDTKEAESVTGKDGRTQATRKRGTSVTPASWELKGAAYKLLVKAQSELDALTRQPFGPVLDSPEAKKAIRYHAARCADAANALLRRLDGQDPDFVLATIVGGDPDDDEDAS